MNRVVTDKIVSIIAYVTFGIFSIIWIVFANVTRKQMTPFLVFNLYQAIFISVILAVFSLIYSIAINFMSVIPFIGKLAKGFDLFFNQTPMYFNYTISGFLVMLLVLYLCFMTLIGKRPYIPIISEIINVNFGG